MGLSIRAYARHRGVSHVAVKKAIDTGRIRPLPDGTIDPQAADAQWAQNTLQPRKAIAQEVVQEVVQDVEQAVASAASTTKERPQRTVTTPQRETPEASAPPLSAGGTSLLQARTVNEVLKAQLNKVELAHRKKELVDRAQAVAHVFKLARIERDAWLNWPARISGQMASTLGVDAHQMHVLLEAAVREHLIELGELRPRVD
ncbi:MAG: elements of external origin [Bacteroidetes bacterium]|nr:elements of external origin [Bacteroidota bacterium]